MSKIKWKLLRFFFLLILETKTTKNYKKVVFCFSFYHLNLLATLLKIFFKNLSSLKTFNAYLDAYDHVQQVWFSVFRFLDLYSLLSDVRWMSQINFSSWQNVPGKELIYLQSIYSSIHSLVNLLHCYPLKWKTYHNVYIVSKTFIHQNWYDKENFFFSSDYRTS